MSAELTPRDRIAAAVEGVRDAAKARVLSADVVAVLETVPEDKRTQGVKLLADHVKRAGEYPDMRTVQPVTRLRELLAASEDQPAPAKRKKTKAADAPEAADASADGTAAE